jgi:amino acid transporter
MIFNLGAMLFASQGLITVSSRLLLRCARDRGLGALSPPLATTHPTLKVPVYAILAATGAVLAIAAINLGSSIALNAVLSATVVLLQVSYTVPIALLFLRGGAALGEGDERRWSMGRWRRAVNGVALVFLIVTTVTFMFPPRVPVRGGDSMNWVVVVAGVVWLACGITWALDGRRRFEGPSELTARLAAAKAA